MRAQFVQQGWLVVVTVAICSCAPAADESAEPMAEAAPTIAAYIPPTVSPESHDLTQAPESIPLGTYQPLAARLAALLSVGQRPCDQAPC